MKVALYTIYKATNYGTQLQAEALYSLLETIVGEGNVRILSEENDIRANIFRPFSKNPITWFKRLNYWIKHETYTSQFQVGNITEKYDAVVIGSDELWNVLNPDLKHSGYYIGKGFYSENIYTYAISCNKAKVTDFVTKYGEKPFVGINEISVRDSMSMELVKTLIGKEPVTVLDPTFLVEFKPKAINEKSYIMVYGYQFYDDEIAEIKRFALREHLKLISVGFEQRWCDRFVLCSNKEFIGYIQKAKYIVTSTFHGTVFSIKYNRQFVSYVRDNSKVKDLLEKFDILSRNATERDLSVIFDEQINYIPINQTIKKEKETSKSWLATRLKGK